MGQEFQAQGLVHKGSFGGYGQIKPQKSQQIGGFAYVIGRFMHFIQ
jgi:hypothetical protein